ncbi:hypothetical protein [Jeongeupia naejangsanensis]|uniref:HNH nuclease domain-containing protein n=1 Tax=Jeongeupia naejangsanensis TaxID=613195 RepID=A0ABS2BGE8_9NEIS|nr:hypothetical protein [Jeongeupia naejangsanensis]MBM3114545.1 hypothetical protein [Jeongeupia naejangsanensis]
MIKLQRNPKPEIIINNEENWNEALKNAISTHGSYSKIPKEIKEKLLIHYKHPSIKTSLFSSSFQKCAFCEAKPAESGNIEVEHYAPKSKHPDLTFCWENFLPACRKCNEHKDDHDTILEPIINPYNNDPEKIFYYEDIRILANNDNKKIGSLTIEVCGLNSARLMRPRADILIGLHGFSEAIAEALKDYEAADTEAKRRNRKRKIKEALEVIEMTATPSEKLSGFCKFYLSKCEPYLKAKSIITHEHT